MIELTHAGASVWAAGAFPRLRAMLLQKRPPRGERIRVLDDISLWIGRGEAWAMLGKKATGKTALLKLIAGRIPPDTGTLRVDGRVAAAIADDDGLLPWETGASNVRLSLLMQGEKEAAIRARIKDTERLLGGAVLDRPVSALDAGCRARLCVAAALAAHPDVLIISSQLERCGIPFQQACTAEIRRMLGGGMTLLLECGDAALAGRLCDSALLLEEGRLKQVGPFESLCAGGRLSAAKTNARGFLVHSRAAFSAPLSPREDGNAKRD